MTKNDLATYEWAMNQVSPQELRAIGEKHANVLKNAGEFDDVTETALLLCIVVKVMDERGVA